jgi:hypothetical protein
MSVQTSDVLNLLQKAIQKKLEDNVPQTTPLLSVIKRNSGVTLMPNNTFYVTEWVGNFSNIVQTVGGEQLTGGKSANVQINVSAKQLYADVTVEEFTVEAMKNVPDGALIDFTKGYVDRMELGIGREMNRTFHAVNAGRVARANGSASSSTSLTVQALDADTSDIDPTQYIEPGDYIKIGSGNGVQVSSISGNVITIAAARSWSDEDAVIKVTTGGTTTDEMASLPSLIVNTGTVQGVNVANYPRLQSYVDTTSHDISDTGEEFMMKAYLKTVAYKVSQNLVGYCNFTVFNAWANKLTALKKTANTGERIQGGINLQGDVRDMPFLDFMQGKVYLDIDCYTGYWYNTDPASMTLGDMGNGVKFAVSPDGKGVWARKVGYTPEYEATLRFYGNLIVKHMRANSKMTNLSA